MRYETLPPSADETVVFEKQKSPVETVISTKRVNNAPAFELAVDSPHEGRSPNFDSYDGLLSKPNKDLEEVKVDLN